MITSDSNGEILLLGDPRLRRLARPVPLPFAADAQAAFAMLHQTLDAFREAHGFGRAVAAPQIGVQYRFIALALGGRRLTMVNPIVTWHSTDTFTLWDDCMSFPDLMVKVARHESISVEFINDDGKTECWSELDRATSELLQHEIDHLDGILSVDRALDREAFAMRSVITAN
ncbi:MAG: peptide deformylase [Pseudomonadota bacterium]